MTLALLLFALTPLTPEQALGREIYHNGTGVVAFLNKGETEAAGHLFPCAGCHGPAGQGNTEAGLRVPPVTWAALAAPNRQRAAYDSPRLIRALMAGLRPDGQPLAAAMPLYRLTMPQARALVEYLRVLNTSHAEAAGVDDHRVAFGVTGPAAVRQAVAAGAAARFADINQRGGLYGRQLVLLDDDDPAALRGRVLATLGPHNPALAALHFGAAPHAVLASHDVLARALADALSSDAVPVSAPQPDPAFLEQWQALGHALRPLSDSAVTVIAHFGGTAGYLALRQRYPQHRIAATIAAVQDLPAHERWPDYLVSPLPAEPPAATTAALGPVLARRPLAVLGWEAAGLAIQALENAGRRLHPAALATAARPHPGARGAYVLRFTAESGSRPVSSAFVIPKEF